MIDTRALGSLVGRPTVHESMSQWADAWADVMASWSRERKDIFVHRPGGPSALRACVCCVCGWICGRVGLLHERARTGQRLAGRGPSERLNPSTGWPRLQPFNPRRRVPSTLQPFNPLPSGVNPLVRRSCAQASGGQKEERRCEIIRTYQSLTLGPRAKLATTAAGAAAAAPLCAPRPRG